MEEVFDRLFIRFFLGFIILLVLFLYRYAHYVFYPTGAKQFNREFFPLKNVANTLHYFGRIIGICLIVSSYPLDGTENIILNYVNIFLWGIASFIIYLLSLYLVESIILPNFDYKTEVLKKENLSYSVVTFFIAISSALIVRQVVTESEDSFIILIMLWLLSLVIFGLATRVYHFFSKQLLNQDIYRKMLGAPLSFSAYIFGISVIIITSLQQEHYDIKSYSLRIILKILLSFLIFPLFIKGLKKLFMMNDHLEYDESSPNPQISLAKGIFEGGLFLSAAFLTLLIVFNVQFSGLINFH